MQLTRTEIINKLQEILISADGDNQSILNGFNENSRLTTDFGFSSVNILYLVIAIEEEFDIRFDNVSMSDFETLGDVVNYIENKLK